ncbi:MAG: cysteine--tRNA ligase [Erysipelotrichales bacterium]|nr:cysteine--tRNA ligase [Erysipelotrichales bacterium]
MHIYNSLTNRKEKFIVFDQKVSMYVCGPTVWNYIHIGNARPVIFFDFVRNYFQYKNIEVICASNITDIDDKIIKRAKEEGVSEKEIAVKYANEFLNDIKGVACKPYEFVPYATDYLAEISDIISELIKKGYAYNVNGDVYFEVNKSTSYGTLSNQIQDQLKENVRINENPDKKAQEDFTLWKKTEEGIKYQSPFGLGRPGWHTECVAMINKLFKHQEIDIHGGGADLVFPHHENEIAQSQALHGHNISRFFVHVGRLDINNEKMSKSLNNVVLLRDLLKSYPAAVIRIFILNSPYRANINFSYELLDQSALLLSKIDQAYRSAYLKLALLKDNEVIYDNEAMEKIEKHIEDDFNLPNVFTEIFVLVKKINNALRAEDIKAMKMNYHTLKLVLDILGIIIEIPELNEEALAIYQEWENLRKAKKFNEADQLRTKLQEMKIL